MNNFIKAAVITLTVFMLSGLPASNANASNTDTSNVLEEFTQTMAQHQGKVVYLDFWASWCVPCRKSFPWMNAMQEKYQQQGLVVLSVNLDAQKTLAEKFLQQTPADFAIIYDAKGVLAKKFQLKGMPSSYLFNRQGKMISAHSGFNGKKQQKYQQEIELAVSQ